MKKIFFLTLIAITVPLILFAFVGCMKKPEIEVDYGPEVALSEIQKLVNDSVPADIESIKKGQYVSIDETQAIDTQAPETYYQRMDEVTQYDKKTDYTELTFRLTLNELIDGKWTPSVRENIKVSYNNVAATQTSSSSFRNQGSKVPLSIQSLKKADSAAEKKITYHNVIQETGITPLPPAVKKQIDCGGLSPAVCGSGLRYMKIKFDRVIWSSDTHGVKTTMSLMYSPDIPSYIYTWDGDINLSVTNQFKTCAQTWLEIPNGSGGNQTVPVMNCSEVRDFQFGSDIP